MKNGLKIFLTTSEICFGKMVMDTRMRKQLWKVREAIFVLTAKLITQYMNEFYTETENMKKWNMQSVTDNL